MNARAFNGWPELGKDAWSELKRCSKMSGWSACSGGRNARGIFGEWPSSAPEAGPERGVDDGLDCLRTGFRCELLLTALACRREFNVPVNQRAR